MLETDERFLAYFTLIWSLTRMHSRVSLESCVVEERLITVLTFITLFLRVRVTVDLKLLHRLKAFPTFRTHIPVALLIVSRFGISAFTVRHVTGIGVANFITTSFVNTLAGKVLLQTSLTFPSFLTTLVLTSSPCRSQSPLSFFFFFFPFCSQGILFHVSFFVFSQS